MQVLLRRTSHTTWQALLRVPLPRGGGSSELMRNATFPPLPQYTRPLALRSS